MTLRAGGDTFVTDVEIIAASLYFSNFALSAIAATLAVKLFRHYRNVGWLVLAAAFLSPFVSLVMRSASSHRLFTYRVIGQAADGAAQMTYRFDIPGFYIAVVVALLLLLREVRHEGQA